MKKYESYKPSGIEYFESIPENWSVYRLSDTAKSGQYTFTGGPFGSDLKTNDYTNEGIRIIQLQNIGIGEFLDDYKIYTSIEKANQLFSCNIFPNDIIVAKMADPVARACLIPNIEERYLMASDGIRLVTSKFFLNKYLVYAINSIHVSFYAQVNSFGSTRLRIGLNTLKKLNIILPPLQEQTSIAHYLDTQTQAIDKKVSLFTQKIETYKALRKSLINETVCRGLDKSVPLKESGIEWIGQIPQHWEVKRVKDIGKVINGATPDSKNAEYWEGEIIWITPTDFGNEKYVSKSSRTITKEGLRNCGTTLIPIRTIIISCRAPIGSMAIAASELCTNQGCKSLIANNIDYLYLYYYLITQDKTLNMLGNGTTFRELSTTNFNNFNVPFPAEHEQTAIAAYLDEKTEKIDKIIANLQKQVAILKELRKTLKNKVVTGKVKVV